MPKLSTEQFITECLPAMATAERIETVIAYTAFRDHIAQVVGDISVPGQCDLDWDYLAEHTDANNGDRGEKRMATAEAAAATAIIPEDLYDEQCEELQTILVHTGPGTFFTVSSEGKLLAFDHEFNPDVPGRYQCIDGVALQKLGDAILIEKLIRQGAEWGEGWVVLAALKRGLSIIGATGRPTIGMATLHEIAYCQATRGTDRHALAYTGTSGRTVSRAFQDYIAYQPSYRWRVEIASQLEYSTDAFAGLADSLSSQVANRAAVYGVKLNTHKVELPNPNDEDQYIVNWN